MSSRWANAAGVIGLACLAGYALVASSTGGFPQSFDSNFLSARHGLWLLCWLLLGGGGALGLSPWLAQIAQRREWTSRFLSSWSAGSDRAWIVGGSLLAMLVPVTLRLVVLRDLPVISDELTYRFAAQIVASGALSLPSPPLKLFFDNGLVINDGRMATQYFLGWPILAAPFAGWGPSGFANALYSGLTVPALFGAARRMTNGVWARVGIALYLSSPMLMLGAATEMSHTACTGALAWLLLAALRARETDSRWAHAGVATAFAAAFWIRPTTAVGLGAPVLVYWTWHWWRGGRRLRAALSFSIPAMLLALCFLAAHASITGSLTVTPYARYLQYMEENDYRFAAFGFGPDDDFPFHSRDPRVWLLAAFVAAIRINGALFGWPASLAFAVLARGRRARLPCAMLASFAALNAPLVDAGAESFAPVHWFEAALPLILLTILGLRRHARVSTGTFVALSIVLSIVGYWPVRVGALRTMTISVARPFDAVSELDNAVVFSYPRFAPICPQDEPTRHFVFWRPNAHPSLGGDVIWVNHLTVEDDLQLMRTVFPEREGYVLGFDEPCTFTLHPLRPGLRVTDVVP